MPAIPAHSVSATQFGRDTRLSKAHRAWRWVIMVVFLIALAVYLAPKAMVALGLVTVADLGVIIAQHHERLYQYDLVVDAPHSDGPSDNNSEAKVIGTAQYFFRFDEQFVIDTRYTVSRIDQVPGVSLPLLAMLTPLGISPDAQAQLSSIVGINEQGLLDRWDLTGAVGNIRAELNLQADRLGMQGNLSIPRFDIARPIATEAIDQQQAAALAGIAALPAGLQVGDRFTMSSGMPSTQPPYINSRTLQCEVIAAENVPLFPDQVLFRIDIIADDTVALVLHADEEGIIWQQTVPQLGLRVVLRRYSQSGDEVWPEPVLPP